MRSFTTAGIVPNLTTWLIPRTLGDLTVLHTQIESGKKITRKQGPDKFFFLSSSDFHLNELRTENFHAQLPEITASGFFLMRFTTKKAPVHPIPFVLQRLRRSWSSSKPTSPPCTSQYANCRMDHLLDNSQEWNERSEESKIRNPFCLFLLLTLYWKTPMTGCLDGYLARWSLLDSWCFRRFRWLQVEKSVEYFSWLENVKGLMELVLHEAFSVWHCFDN